MTPEQATVAIDLLESGSTLREAAAIVREPWPRFTERWTTGRKDHGAGRESDAATFYADAQAARARCTTLLRRQADDAAGTREASDRLALLARLTEEQEPEAADEDASHVRALEMWPSEAVWACDTTLRVLAGTDGVREHALEELRCGYSR